MMTIPRPEFTKAHIYKDQQLLSQIFILSTFGTIYIIIIIYIHNFPPLLKQI